MGLRYVRVRPIDEPRSAGGLDLRLEEAHRPPAYLATVRLFPGRSPAADPEHVREIAAPVLARLASASPADYLTKGRVLERARTLLRERVASGESLSARFEADGLAFEPGRELVTTTLDPRERDVFRVHWENAHALTFWVARAAGTGTAELCWASERFRADQRLRPRAVEHAYELVPWAVAELAPLASSLLERPRTIELGLPLETTA